VLLLGGCASKGKPAADGGAGSGGGTAGAGAARVDAGGGSGGGEGGGIDAAGGGSGGTPTTAEQVCRAAIHAWCDRGAVCSGGVPGTASDCTAGAAACPDYFFNSSSTRTVAGITGCLDELARQPCSDRDLGLFPSCWGFGTRPAGAACVYSSTCASGGCTGGGTMCGSCTSGPAATGEACGTLRCRAGEFCHPGTRVCTPGSTIVHATPGAACDLSADPAVGCAGDMRCIGPYGQTAGTCQRPPVWDVGQPCYQVTNGSGNCRPELQCVITITGTATTSECQELPPERSCPTAPCDATSFCKAGDGGLQCVPRAAVGETCRNDGGLTAECMRGLLCWGSTGVCTVYSKRGESCIDDVQPCDQYLVCRNGRCEPLGADACPLSSGDAAAP
jgi:hypothetical protein